MSGNSGVIIDRSFDAPLTRQAGKFRLPKDYTSIFPKTLVFPGPKLFTNNFLSILPFGEIDFNSLFEKSLKD